KILMTIGLEYGSEIYQYVTNNKERFVEISDKQTVERSLEMANYWYVVSIMRNKEASFEDVKKAAADYSNAYPGPQSQRMERMAYLGYYTDKKQYEEYFKLQDQYIAEDLKSDKKTGIRTIQSALNDVAMNNSFSEVKDANGWAIKKANQLIKIDPQVTTSYIALASVYKRMGNQELTNKYADLYLSKKKESGEDVTQRTMDYINQLRKEH
ncbi:MAG: hypothetical protein MI866_13050, partial [Bacteroidales bacterium]|nr:hypothetical protein [Bacteroidales bacterium]